MSRFSSFPKSAPARRCAPAGLQRRSIIVALNGAKVQHLLGSYSPGRHAEANHNKRPPLHNEGEVLILILCASVSTSHPARPQSARAAGSAVKGIAVARRAWCCQPCSPASMPVAATANPYPQTAVPVPHSWLSSQAAAFRSNRARCGAYRQSSSGNGWAIC